MVERIISHKNYINIIYKLYTSKLEIIDFKYQIILLVAYLITNGNYIQKKRITKFFYYPTVNIMNKIKVLELKVLTLQIIITSMKLKHKQIHYNDNFKLSN